MPTLVFVFGTLKQGFPNAATNRGARWPGNFRTEAAFPLYLVGERHVPWLLNAPGTSCPPTSRATLGCKPTSRAIAVPARPRARASSARPKRISVTITAAAS